MAKGRSAKPLVTNGPQGLFVAPWTREMGGFKRHVVLRVGETLDSQMIRLTASEARRVAMALLEAAEEVEEAS